MRAILLDREGKVFAEAVVPETQGSVVRWCVQLPVRVAREIPTEVMGGKTWYEKEFICTARDPKKKWAIYEEYS